MDGWMDGRTDGRMDGWMDGWITQQPTIRSDRLRCTCKTTLATV